MTLEVSTREFIDYCQFEKKLNHKTLKAYKTDLEQFKLFLSGINNIVEVSKFDIRRYLVSISSLKPKSIKRKIASIKALFNYLEFEDKIIINPFRKIRIQIKEPMLLRPVMDIDEIKKIFKFMYENKSNSANTNSYTYFEWIRNIVVIELLFSTGARVSEIADLKIKSLNLESGCITIKGKGEKERTIQICNIETLTLLKNYFTLYQKELYKSGGWFLINRLKRKLSDQSIRIIVKNIYINAGLSKHITPHIFRHTFATLLLEENVDIKYIQNLLGHSSITTTQIYTHVNLKHQREILTLKHPRKEFSFSMEFPGAG